MSQGALEVRVGQCSDAGRHTPNQDFHGAALPPEPQRSRKGLVVALADGIGSSPVSHLASAAAVRGFLDDYYATSETWPVRRAAQRVLAATNAWLNAQSQQGEGRFSRDRGWVCTFSALVFKGREVHLLHVGDSRIYRLHPQSLEPLTEDHRLHIAGERPLLARALGAAAAVEIDYACWSAVAGETYLLATDGVYDFLDAAAVHAALAAHGDDLDAAATALVALAYERGSPDNLTLQIARVDALPPAGTGALPVGREGREGLALPPPLAPRQRFEGYTVGRPLHTSPRSHLHLAVDDATGAQVVLKTPSVDARDNADHLDRFLLEEWVALRLDSPHVLKAMPPARERQHLFVAMEYVEGQTLAQWMTDHPRPSLDEVRRIVEQAARGLQAFHRKEMLHQDLRPENLMIDATGTVRIIDFGSVHVAGLAEGTAEAGAGTILGALQYTAPEYFTGEGGTPRSDLFSLAVLTYQMLSGRLPYGLQVPQVRGERDLLKLQYEPVRTTRRDLPAWVDSVLRQALQPRPALRHEAVSAFVHDLQHPGAVHLRDQRQALIERDPVRFWQALALALALLVVVLAGALVRQGASSARPATAAGKAIIAPST